MEESSEREKKMKWEKKSEAMTIGNAPGKRWGHTCNAIKGGKLLYVFGGYGQNNCQTNQVHVFDTDTQTWSEPPIQGNPPTPRDSHTCTTVGDNLFVFGGTDGLNPLRDLHILDTSSHTWVSPSVFGDGPEAREGHSAALVGKRLFIFGGCGKSMYNSEVYYNDIFILDTEMFMWQQVLPAGTPPAPRDSHSCSTWRNKIIVIGGEDANDYYLSDVHMLDTDTFEWSELCTTGQLLPPRAGHSTIAFGKYIFVFGGFTDAQNLYDDLYMLDLDTCVWTKILPSGFGPSARFSMSGDCLDPSKEGVLVYVGGCDKNLEALDDMYYLHTELVRDDGREVRRMEKLSLRKQLKLKCQEQYASAGTAGSSQQSQQYFPLNMFHPASGKRAFHARVIKNAASGYTIETVIDGKPMRGILFSNAPTTNPNPDGKTDGKNVECRSSRDQEPVTRLPTSHEPHAEAPTPSSMKDKGHVVVGQSQEVGMRDPPDLIGSSSGAAGSRAGAARSRAGPSTTLENPPMPANPESLAIREIPPASAEGSGDMLKNQAENLTTLENPPATTEGSGDMPTNQEKLATQENPPASAEGSGHMLTDQAENLTILENPPAAAEVPGAMPTNQAENLTGLENPPAAAEGSSDMPTNQENLATLENPPASAEGSDDMLTNEAENLTIRENPPAAAEGSSVDMLTDQAENLATLENPPVAAEGSVDLLTDQAENLATIENPPVAADGSGVMLRSQESLTTLENPPVAAEESVDMLTNQEESLTAPENPLAAAEGSGDMLTGQENLATQENPPAVAEGSGEMHTNQATENLTTLEIPSVAAEGPSDMPTNQENLTALENPPPAAEGHSDMSTNQDDQAAGTETTGD